MYGITAGETFGFFEGRRLDAVTYGRYKVSLFFDEGVGLDVEGVLAVTVTGGDERSAEDARDLAAPLLDLLSLTVTAVRVDAPSSLALEFENGTVVRAIDDLGPYECFDVHHGGHIWIM
ncbi:hypothetical protein SAMN04487788_2537 [Microbacterium testaceum StLB037]|uniref:Uncharacterized protein n=1 Tax=Microbacterium testaceum (strain StLB037) TaxID=979556 RepID=A0A1H0QU99_MICTS|nr:DUF6188 family protein [Microbacterium testaceum]SDP20359.1 hypothetical protein SAMN04487788_2537 [Microbacterium testaceum StLB037]